MLYQYSPLSPSTCMVGLIMVLIGLDLSQATAQATSQATTVPPASELYLDELLEQFGSNQSLSINQLSGLLDAVRRCGHSDSHFHDKQATPTCNWTDVKWTSLSECATSKCLSAADLFAVQELDDNETLSSKQLLTLSPLLLYEVHKKSCCRFEEKLVTHIEPSTTAETWGYGFLCVTIVNILALCGAVFLPIMNTKLYKIVITWMVGLAVGTLAATAVIILIPKAWGLISTDVSEDPVPRVVKSLTVLGGIYMFFVLERLLKIVMEIRKKRHHENENENKDDPVEEGIAVNSIINRPKHSHCMEDISHFRDPSRLVNGESVAMTVYNKDLVVRPETSVSNSMPEKSTTDTEKTIENTGRTKSPELENDEHQHGHSHGNIASVAWMIIIGDGLHNFVDGLSIGAAFTESFLSGISVSVAVGCEELPHELGDFAILIKSGMSVKKAMCYNFLSASMCYFGLITGIVIGENTSSTDWIFAIAGGMFLYIALVDMTPEMNITAEEEEKRRATVCDIRVFILQHMGILMGVAIITVMALFDSNIDFTNSSSIQDDTVTAAV